MSILNQDLRYAVRALLKTPALTLVIILSLAIGIGANSAVFSVVDALLLRPLPYPQPERLVAIWLHSPGIGIFRDWPSPGQYIDIRTQNHSFTQMSISRLTTFTLTGRDQPEEIAGMRTSSSLLHMLGARPLLGRLLLPEEDTPGKPDSAVLSYRIWQRSFNSDRSVIGKSITLNGRPFTVVGVLQPGFMLNSEVMPAEGPMDKLDIFTPLPLGADAVNRRGDENYNLMAQLRSGVSVRQAQADIDVIADRIRVKDKRDRTFGMTVTGLLDQVVGDVRRAMLVLLGSVALVLLCACANVANLLLTRAAGREKEVAIRTALGAGWKRLVRQLLTESLLLSFAGAVAGLIIAEGSLYLLRVINPGNVPRLEEIGINSQVLLFTFAISTAAGLLFGLAPAWRAIKLDLNTSLKSGGRSGQADGGLLLSRHRLRALLVVSELALSLVLLAGAGLLIRSFIRLQNIPPGFETSHILSMQTLLGGPKYHDEQAVVQFYRNAGDRIARLPGVVSQGQVSVLPLTGVVGWGGINVEGYAPPPGQELQVDQRVASPDYFRTMKIPLVKGRYFDEHDDSASRAVAIIDAPFAERFWPNADPIGKHLWFDPKKPMTIVGVVGMVKQYGLDSGSKLVAYYPHAQMPSGEMYIVARTVSDPSSLSNAIVAEIHALEPAAPVTDVRTMQERLYTSMARQRFATTMLGAFAGFALLLAAVGIYGVISYLVTQNTHDIGVRVALGAQPGNILGLVVRQGMILGAVGIAAGAIGAVALTRLMSSLLFGVSATDALTFGAVIVILGAVVLAATALPARRATSLDPMVALREE